jgi:X-X-X-Leu-X-X-Gly heptad repeat protein
MNILITGIHGFVGSNLVAALKNQHNIYGLDIISPQKDGVKKTFNWNELDNIPTIDAIIHLAGKAHDTKSQTEAQVYFDINTGLTQKMYDWFLSNNTKKFIFFSSVKAAADRVEGDILTEDVVPSPRGAYGESKIAAENYILNKLTVDSEQLTVGSEQLAVGSEQLAVGSEQLAVGSEQLANELSTINYQLSSKKTYILRPCMIHGPGNKGNLNLLYKVVKMGIPYPLGAFENRRSFTSIDNLSFVVAQLIEKDVETGIYNVGDDENLSTNELISLMSIVMNKPNRIWKWNKSIIQYLAGVGTLLHLPLNTDRLQKLTENYVVSNAKLKHALGIKSMPFSSKEGFIKTIKSFEN